jgi:hypothetical protein
MEDTGFIQSIMVWRFSVDNVRNSIKRARKLLKTPANIENYLSIKIKPLNGFCCCFHCWPLTWEAINNEISPYGPLIDEGDALIGSENNRLVLECHESGPEIILYLGFGITTLDFILNIVSSIIRNRQREKNGSRFIITKRVIRKTKIIEEDVVEIDSPLSKDNIKLLNEKLNDILNRRDG